MSSSDRTYFASKLHSAHARYRQDRDHTRYFTYCATAAVNLWIAEQNELLKRMGKAGLVLPTVLSASSPALMAAVDALSDSLHCPVDNEYSAKEFLSHFGQRVKGRYHDEYVKPVHNALSRIGLLSA